MESVLHLNERPAQVDLLNECYELRKGQELQE